MNTRDDKDTSGVKNVSTFISEIADRIPKNVLPYVSVLSPHLDGEVKKFQGNSHISPTL